MTRLLPGLAAFVAAMLVALFGLYARRARRSRGGTTPRRRHGAREAAAAGRERLPRPPGAAASGDRGSRLAEVAPRPRVPTRPHDPRARRRHGGRHAAHLELVPRRADNRGRQRDRLRRRHAGEPRVRRGRRRADAAAAGRPPDRAGGAQAGRDRPAGEHLLARVRGCGLPLHRGKQRRPRRRAAAPALPDRRAGGRAGWLHRRHDALHADLPARPARRALPLHRHLRRGEPMGAGAAPPRRGGDRGPGPRRRTDAGRRRTRRTTSARSSTRHAR